MLLSLLLVACPKPEPKDAVDAGDSGTEPTTFTTEVSGPDSATEDPNLNPKLAVFATATDDQLIAAYYALAEAPITYSQYGAVSLDNWSAFEYQPAMHDPTPCTQFDFDGERTVTYTADGCEDYSGSRFTGTVSLTNVVAATESGMYSGVPLYKWDRSQPSELVYDAFTFEASGVVGTFDGAVSVDFDRDGRIVSETVDVTGTFGDLPSIRVSFTGECVPALADMGYCYPTDGGKDVIDGLGAFAVDVSHYDEDPSRPQLRLVGEDTITFLGTNRDGCMRAEVDGEEIDPICM